MKVLKTGGSCKTDFYVTIETREAAFVETFSAKFTDKNQVSCHEYDYKRFATVLRCTGEKLEEYLKLFQQSGGYQTLEQNLPNGFSIEEFVYLLAEKKSILAEWVLSGAHDNENILEPELQISKNIFIKTQTNMICETTQSYIKRLEANSKTKSMMGTIFMWTYPSKRKGEKIQLKVPILT